MVNKKNGAQKASNGTIRLSVTLPALDYGELQRLAGDRRLSLGWLVRDAVRRYLTQRHESGAE